MTTPKQDQDAPTTAPNVKADTPTSVVVNDPKSDEEYSIDGGKTWVKPDENGDVKFDGLTPGKEYEVSRKAGDDTHNPSESGPAAKVTTPKEDQDAPNGPGKDNVTSTTTSITIDPTVAGNQYIVVPKGTTPSENDWNTKSKTSDHGEALTFDGLTPGVEYDVISRKPADDTHNPSAPSNPTTVETKQEQKTPTKTTQNAPNSAPNARADSSTSIVVDPAVAGEEYSIDGGKTWVKPTGGKVVFDGLQPNTEYEVVGRKAGTDNMLASGKGPAAKVTTLKEEQDAPEAPNAEVIDGTSIRISPVSPDEEYSIDGGKTWVKPGDGANELVFNDLMPGTEYTVVSRKAETETKAASPASPAVTLKTDEEVKAAEEITEEEVPLAPTPAAKASWALANLILAVSTIGLALFSVLKKRDESDSDNRKRKLIRTIGLAPAVAAAVTYLLTQDMSTPMAVVDKWTVLMAGYLALYGVTAFLARDKKTAPEA